ncbi:MAG: tRNA 5-methoxyuridine(34)/uridine 5-oxyacetic acid(34) synthase CmoB [Gammaproteobacteria bacterium]|nr:tRNA 5-methoxyuridine(34)/uridine 5-oxyacetic acid(34) synthase CmoB [Gammaproteobacteria bacterium]
MYYDSLFDKIRGTLLEPWLDTLEQQIETGLNQGRHGDLPRWQNALDKLPNINAAITDLNQAAIAVTASADSEQVDREEIKNILKELMPWRKGPYLIHGVEIDTEWHSDWKWDRVKNHIKPLVGKTVLDVGCGNGYHGWRMLGEGADLVIGIDPSPLFIMQYQAVRHFAGHYPLYVLPLGIEHVPANLKAFDTVFSMGVLYHRRSPIDHLLQLKNCLQAEGQLVLETLVIDGDSNQVLVPGERYAKMRNVWFIPSAEAILHWLKRCGFKDIKLVDINTTSIEEQRTTDWMPFESLKDFLDQDNTALTIEGYPAPQRAIFTASAP